MSENLSDAASWSRAFLTTDAPKQPEPDLAQLTLREDFSGYATGVTVSGGEFKRAPIGDAEGGQAVSDVTSYATGVDFSALHGKSVFAPVQGTLSVTLPAHPSLQGKRFNQGKPRIDLVAPSILTAIGRVAAFGAEKYGDRNWEKGMEYGKVYASLMRHLIAWWAGEDKDGESGLAHLDHIAWNVQALVEYARRIEAGTLPAEVDDRPYRGK